MDRFRQARDLGGQFLQRQLGEDGRLGDVGEYYKVIAALQVCGRTEAANRLCNWIRRHGMLENGDFGPRPDSANSYFYTYLNIWVIIGAQRLGQFDLAHRGMDFLMGFHDPASGGFYSSPLARDADTRQDLWVVSGCGLASLYTGRLEVARGVGRWMRRLLEDQPAYPERMYTVYSRSAGLHSAPPNPDSADASDDDDVRYCLVNASEGDQYFFHPGIAGGFLAKLYLATGQREWLDLAIEYMRFAETATPHLLSLLRAGKVAWAAAVLYTITGEAKYRELAVTVGDNMIAQQAADGCWDWQGSRSNDITAEMVVWLDEVYQSVGSG